MSKFLVKNVISFEFGGFYKNYLFLARRHGFVCILESIVGARHCIRLWYVWDEKLNIELFFEQFRKQNFLANYESEKCFTKSEILEARQVLNDCKLLTWQFGNRKPGQGL